MSEKENKDLEREVENAENAAKTSVEEETTENQANAAEEAVEKDPLEEANEQIAKLKDQQNKLYDLLEQGIYSQEIFLERQQFLNDKRSSMQKELVELRSKIPVSVDYTDIIASIDRLLSEYPTLSATEKNSLLCGCVKKITYYRDKSNRYDQKPVSLEIELKV